MTTEPPKTKRVTMTVDFEVDVPVDVDPGSLCLEIHDYETLSISTLNREQIEAEIVAHQTTMVTLATGRSAGSS